MMIFQDGEINEVSERFRARHEFYCMYIYTHMVDISQILLYIKVNELSKECLICGKTQKFSFHNMLCLFLLAEFSSHYCVKYATKNILA